jgi:hypothetical protein
MSGKKERGNDHIYWDEMWNGSGDTQFDESHALDTILNDMVEDIEDWDSTLLDGLEEIED